jgi:hypothetical protein
MAVGNPLILATQIGAVNSLAQLTATCASSPTPRARAARSCWAAPAP